MFTLKKQFSEKYAAVDYTAYDIPFNFECGTNIIFGNVDVGNCCPQVTYQNKKAIEWKDGN